MGTERKRRLAVFVVDGTIRPVCDDCARFAPTMLEHVLDEEFSDTALGEAATAIALARADRRRGEPTRYSMFEIVTVEPQSVQVEHMQIDEVMTSEDEAADASNLPRSNNDADDK